MSLRRLTTRAAAYVLIALVVFPFSAPLSACDLSDLVPNSTPSYSVPLSNAPLHVSVLRDALAQSFPIGAHTRIRVAAAPRSPSAVEAGGNTALSARCAATRKPGPARPMTKTILRI